MTTWNPIKLTAMHHQHLGLGAAMGDYLGWQRPAQYTSSEQELETVRRAGGICDVSPVGKFYLQGDDVPALLQRALPEVATLEINRAAVGVLSGSNGPIAERVLACRFADDEVFILSPPDTVAPVGQALKERLAGCAHMVDMTSNFAAITTAGPLSAHLLSKMTDLDLSPEVFPDLSCAQGQVAEVYAIVVRQDLQDLPCYDVYFGRDFGEYLWDAMLEAGHEYGITPFGVEALTRLAGGG